MLFFRPACGLLCGDSDLLGTWRSVASARWFELQQSPRVRVDAHYWLGERSVCCCSGWSFEDDEGCDPRLGLWILAGCLNRYTTSSNITFGQRVLSSEKCTFVLRMTSSISHPPAAREVETRRWSYCSPTWACLREWLTRACGTSSACSGSDRWWQLCSSKLAVHSASVLLCLCAASFARSPIRLAVHTFTPLLLGHCLILYVSSAGEPLTHLLVPRVWKGFSMVEFDGRPRLAYPGGLTVSHPPLLEILAYCSALGLVMADHVVFAHEEGCANSGLCFMVAADESRPA